MQRYLKKEEFTHYQGTRLTAEWFYTASLKIPGLDYYFGLNQQDRVRLDQIIKYICDASPGTIFPLSLYRIEDRENKIYALKRRDERFFNFTTEGSKIIITNAYHKHSQQMTKADLEHLKVAATYRKDYLIRVKQGVYYEN